MEIFEEFPEKFPLETKIYKNIFFGSAGFNHGSFNIDIVVRHFKEEELCFKVIFGA